jgi:hypothetical protein
LTNQLNFSTNQILEMTDEEKKEELKEIQKETPEVSKLQQLNSSTDSLDSVPEVEVKGEEHFEEDEPEIEKSGYLYKKGDVNKASKKRWFSLTKKDLSYYKNKDVNLNF